MPHQHQSAPRPPRNAGSPLLVPVLGGALACGLVPTALAGGGVQWRLEAQVPVMCAILSVETLADRPASVAIATTCNAERFQLVLGHRAPAPPLRAARSSAGAAQISGSVVTITSARPGYALTTIDLAAPVEPGQVVVTLQPL
ncbi:MAG: hypothetical protein MUF47_08630 [Porphyrobacter sp.]|jgi:hypothetical protein|nr:hypothetical protein [Porphyrobacter sp.]